MARMLLDISQLPQGVLTYTNKRFFDFIEGFCGKDEADLLSIQAIRSVDSFLFIEDVYSIFTVDSEDVIEIQTRCAFKNRNEQWFVQNTSAINFRNINFVCGIDYHLKFSPSLDKVEVLCSCGSTSSLVLAESDNFKKYSMTEALLSIPLNVFDLRDKDFFNFIEQFCGEAVMEYFELLGVRSVNSLLGIDDIFAPLQEDYLELVDIKKK
ncbi:unnamed protein product [Rotaria sp. Silwood1]|nr:unnamed protein product [Rotaria sp. Silwood1]